MAYAADVERQRPDLPAEDRPVGDMTVGELRALLREVLEEKRRRDYYIDVKNRAIYVEDVDKHDEAYRRLKRR
ncbi:MAG TPA: hypothetical protein EYP49_02085 [Anaerolineae bacterium]|nr:hypothetical protein [Anaerolineae bacterium]